MSRTITFLRTALGLSCGLFCSLQVSFAQSPVSKEYQIKAAFLYNFTKFVEWPQERFAGENAPFVIGVLGRNPFGDELEKIVHDRKVNGRTIVIRDFASATEASAASRSLHVLFVAAG